MDVNDYPEGELISRTFTRVEWEIIQQSLVNASNSIFAYGLVGNRAERLTRDIEKMLTASDVLKGNFDTKPPAVKSDFPKATDYTKDNLRYIVLGMDTRQLETVLGNAKMLLEHPEFDYPIAINILFPPRVFEIDLRHKAVREVSFAEWLITQVTGVLEKGK